MTKRLEIDAIVEVRSPGRYSGKRGIIQSIGQDCGGRLYMVAFLKPVTIGGEKFRAIAFHGPALRAL
jgi:hypothetical protein